MNTTVGKLWQAMLGSYQQVLAAVIDALDEHQDATKEQRGA
jgi:hypothetical protein